MSASWSAHDLARLIGILLRRHRGGAGATDPYGTGGVTTVLRARSGHRTRLGSMLALEPAKPERYGDDPLDVPTDSRGVSLPGVKRKTLVSRRTKPTDS